MPVWHSTENTPRQGAPRPDNSRQVPRVTRQLPRLWDAVTARAGQGESQRPWADGRCRDDTTDARPDSRPQDSLSRLRGVMPGAPSILEFRISFWILEQLISTYGHPNWPKRS
jgi:hypothetical protein